MIKECKVLYGASTSLGSPSCHMTRCHVQSSPAPQCPTGAFGPSPVSNNHLKLSAWGWRLIRTLVKEFCPPLPFMMGDDEGHVAVFSCPRLSPNQGAHCFHFIVTGAAALLWAYVPTATAADIKRALLQGVDRVSGASESLTRVSKSDSILRDWLRLIFLSAAGLRMWIYGWTYNDGCMHCFGGFSSK